MSKLTTAAGRVWSRVNRARHTMLELVGVVGIAAAGATLHEGWAYLVLGVYAVFAANANGDQR